MSRGRENQGAERQRGRSAKKDRRDRAEEEVEMKRMG